MQRGVTFILLLITTVFSQAQDYGFLLKSQQYKLDQFDQNFGLNNPFVYTINQADNGSLLVGTGEGVGVFDGENFEMYYTETSIKKVMEHRSHQIPAKRLKAMYRILEMPLSFEGHLVEWRGWGE